jgi:VanZ family protein
MFKAIKQNILSIFIALLIMYLSLANSSTFDEVPVFDFPYIDKLVHFGMYFTLMISLLFEHRSTNKELWSQFLMAIIPLGYGILLEFIQSYFTTTRSGDVFDAIFNFIGIAVALAGWRIVFSLVKKEN